MLATLAKIFGFKSAEPVQEEAPAPQEVKAEVEAKPKKKPAVKKAASGEKKPRAKKTK